MFVGRSELVWRALLATDPSNIEYARDLAACYETEAMLRYRWSECVPFFQKTINIREDVARRFPANLSYARELAKSHQLFGWTAIAYFRDEVAEDHLNRSIEILDRLSDSHPGDPDVLSDLGDALHNFAGMFKRSQQFERAVPLALRGVTILDELVARHPTRPRYRLVAGWSCRSLGQILILTREFQDAVQVATRGAAYFEGLRADYPETRTLPWEVADQLVVLIVALSSTGRGKEAEQAIARLERLGNLGDKELCPESLAEIAWYLILASGPELPNDLTLQCLARALELKPNSMLALHTLGMIEYRAGRWDEAIETLTRASQLNRNPAYPIEALLLAMAFHHKGDAAQSHEWVDRYLAWAANQGEKEYLYRLSRFVYVVASDIDRVRDEAALLLNIDLKPAGAREDAAATSSLK